MPNDLEKALRAYFNGADSAPVERLLNAYLRRVERKAMVISISVGLAIILGLMVAVSTITKLSGVR